MRLQHSRSRAGGRAQVVGLIEHGRHPVAATGSLLGGELLPWGAEEQGLQRHVNIQISL